MDFIVLDQMSLNQECCSIVLCFGATALRPRQPRARETSLEDSLDRIGMASWWRTFFHVHTHADGTFIVGAIAAVKRTR